RIVLAVGREHEGDDLGVGPIAVGEQRTHGTVDQAGGDDLFFRRPPFALEEAARNAPCGVGVLAVVDRQRQEVALDAALDFHASGGEDDRVAVADGAGAIGLLGQVTRFDDHGPRADGDLFALPHGFSFLFLVFSCLSSAYVSDRPARLGVAASRGGGGGEGSEGSAGPETGERVSGRLPAESVGGGVTCGARGVRWSCGNARGPSP